ncbi:MAG: RNA polymerase sigma-70 factor [Chitinophagaceae bacterium]|nr:RNA polymerase sigma-70 factor [Chitinophagaceae bacterium]
MQNELQIQYWVERVALFNDGAAYEKLFFHYNDSLFNLAVCFVKDEVVAEEIVSDVFINVWRNRSRLPEIENLKVYLYVSVKNLCIKHLTRNKQIADFNLDDLNLESAAATAQTPEDLLVSKEVLKYIHKAIESLPPKCRLIFKLVREDGLKYKEIAQILNISVKTIDAQMAIAAKKITQSLSFLLEK